MGTEHKNPKLNCQKLAEVFLSNPLIEDCYFMIREGELVAYIVCSGALNYEQLSSDLESQLPDNLLPNIYVQISSLPLTDRGDVDEVALKNIEIIDDNQVQETEEKLSSLPDIEQVAAVMTSKKIKILPLHLSELLPLKIEKKNDNQKSETSIHLGIHTSNTQAGISHGQLLEESGLQPKTLAEILQKAAENYSNKGIIYIQSNGSEVFQSYQQLWEDAQQIQAGLQKQGLQAQDKVILQLSENYDIISAFWGCILGGFIPVIISVPPSYKDFNNEIHKICQVWQLLDDPIIITNQSCQQEIKHLEQWLPNQTLSLSFIEELKTYSPHQPPISQLDDIAFFNLTSGSTGIPKCIALTHKNVISRARGTNIICEHQNDDVILNWLPFDHIGSISDWNIRCVELGCQMVYVQTEYILGRPLNWLDLINQYRITHSWAPNFAYNLINEALKKEPDQNWNLDCVKFFLAAGEAVSGQAVGEFINTLHLQYNLKKTAMRPAFGMAEMGSGITYYQPTEQQPLLFHTVDKSSLNSSLKRVHPEHPKGATFTDLGLPIPGISIRIVNTDNSLLPEETIGHLQVKGEPVSPGYYKNPEANQDAFLKDGWFKTGDLAFISNGHLVITGRSKETIIINGVNYYSHEIETVVETIDEVEASYTAACGVHDPSNSTDQLALFFSAETFDHQHLAELLKKIRRKVINTFGVNPEYLIPLNKTEIPKTSIGKIQRSQLTKRFANGEFNSILKEIDLLLENANTLPDWFYRKVWRPRSPVNLKPELSKYCSLIFLDSLGLGASLAEKIQGQNLPCITVLAAEEFSQISQNCYTLRPGTANHYQQLMASLSERKIILVNIIHLGTYQDYQGEISTIEQLEKAQEKGTYDLLFLVQSLAKIHDLKSKIQLLFVSSYSQFVIETDETAYEKSPVLGLIKTLAKELPWLNTRHVDLPLDNPEINVSYLLQELSVLSKEREIAYRNGKRLIAGLEKVNLLQHNQQELPFKLGGIYLITGGLGGIGRQIAQYLLKNYQARLLLIGKTPLPDKHLWSEYLKVEDQLSLKIKNLQALETLGGQVIYQAVDVANFTEVKQAVEQVKKQWQGELDGVIHLAGIYKDCLLLEETQEGLATIIRPKVIGTWVLHQLLKESQGIFISFSSLASFFGGAALGSYAAANSFLESLNSYQKSKNLFPSYCYSWTTWQETGISQGYQMQYITRSQGYYDMTVQQGLDSFLTSLYHNQGQLLIGLDGSNSKINRFTSLSEGCQKLTAYYTRKPTVQSVNLPNYVSLKDRFGTSYQCPLVQRQSLPIKDNGDIDKRQLIKELQGKENSELIAPRTETERQVANIWQKVLNLSQIGIHDNFFELGGHSLLASQVISRLRDVFSVELSLHRLLEYPTVASLAQTIEVLNVAKNTKSASKSGTVMTTASENYEEGEL